MWTFTRFPSKLKGRAGRKIGQGLRYLPPTQLSLVQTPESCVPPQAQSLEHHSCDPPKKNIKKFNHRKTVYKTFQIF